MEEFIPTMVKLRPRAPKISTLIGPQEKPSEGDIGATGEPISDLAAQINNELAKERIVFLLDGTLFFLGKRLYRTNDEFIFRPQDSTKLEHSDLKSLETEWKIHPYFEDGVEEEEEIPTEVLDEDQDIEDLPFDTNIRS